MTHVVQLKYAKPSEMVPVLQPFVKIPNAILPIDGSQMLVLRDYTENVKRMLELIKEMDVAVPSEFVSEVIPIKYAQASEIANALNSLSTGGGGASIGGGGTGGTRSTSPEHHRHGQPDGRDRRHGRLSGTNHAGMGMPPSGAGTTPGSAPAAAPSPSASRTSSTAPLSPATFRSWARPRSSRTSAPTRC